MSRPRPLSASKSCLFAKPVQLGRANIRSAQINTASLTFMRPPKFRHKKLSQESLQKDNQLWELTQEVKKLEEQQKSFINKFEVQNESLPNTRPSIEIEEIKRERDELYESKIKSQNYIEKLEEEAKKMQESYEKELKNMNEYVGLLRRKISKCSSISLTNSPQPPHNEKLGNFEELFLKEKEKSSILYNTLKIKEKECENLHKRNDSESILVRMEQLTSQNNNYQSALAEAESEIKRLHLEISDKNEQIFQKKQKIEELEIQSSLTHLYEEAKIKLKKSNEEKKQLEGELKRNSLKSDELEKIIEELGKSLLTMTKELEDRNSECQNLENELEKLKDQDKNSEKNIEKEKEECLKMIEIVANEINQEISGLMLRVEQAEDQVDKILDFFEEFKSWIDQNMSNQSMKNDENLLIELSQLRQDKDELKNKLDTKNSKIFNYEDEVNKLKLLLKEYEDQISIYKENLQNGKCESEDENSDIKQVQEDYDILYQEHEKLNQICKERDEEIENLKNKLRSIEIKLKESQSSANLLKNKNKQKIGQYENLQQKNIDNSEEIEKLIIENKELKDQIALLIQKLNEFDDLNEKLKESDQQLRDKEIEADEANQLYEALKSKTEEILKEQLKMKFESQLIKDEFENEKIRLQDEINKALEEKTLEVEILKEAIKEQQDVFERQLSELRWENQQENVNNELEQKNNEIKTLKDEYNGIIKRNEKELKESYEKEINKLRMTSEANHSELMGKYVEMKSKYEKYLEDARGFEALKQEMSAIQGNLREKEKEIDKLKEELFEADEKIEYLENNQTVQEGAVSEYKKQLESQEKKIIGLHDELECHKDSIENDIKLTKLQAQLEDLKQENETLREKLATSFSDPEIASMQSQISHLTQNLEKTEIELLRKSEIEEELRILEDKFNSKAQKLTVLKNVCSELEVVNSSLRTSKVEIESELGKKEKIIKDMQREFGTQNVEVNKIKQRADQFEDLYNSLYAEMEEKCKKIENLEKELDVLTGQGKISEINLGIENVNGIEIYGEMTISDEENEKDNSREENYKDSSDEENSKESEDEEKQRLQERINELTDDIDLLLGNEEKYKIIIEKLQEKLKEESDDPEGLKGRVEDLEAQLGDYQYRYDQLVEEHEELINNQKERLDTSQDGASIQMLSEELSKVINEKNQLEIEIDTLRDLHGENEKIKHYQQEAENLAKICDEIENSKEDLEEKYNENLQMLKAKYEEFIKERMEEITDQYEELQENSNRLEIEKSELEKELEAEKEKNSVLQEKLYKYLNKNN